MNRGEFVVSIDDVLRMENERDIDGLVNVVLHDINPDIKIQSAAVLGKIGDVRAVEPLKKALKDPNKNVRYRAAKALGILMKSKIISEDIISQVMDLTSDLSSKTNHMLESIFKSPSSEIKKHKRR